MRIASILFLFGLSTSVIAQPKNLTDDKGKKHGPWEVTYKNSSTIRYEGSFEHGLPDGKFTYYSPDGKLKTESVFSNDGKENTAIMYYPSGRKMAEGKYIEKKKAGEWLFYDERGVLRSKEFYLNGERNGTSLSYNYDGILIKEMQYVQDVEHGEVKEYYPNTKGLIMRQYNYDKGTKEGESKFLYENGKLKNKGRYKFDMKDGWWTEYLESGNIWKHERFEKGELKETNMINGELITYFPNGIPATVYNYKAGKKNGPFREYYNVGDWKLEAVTSDAGNVVDKKRYLDGEKLKMMGKYFDDQFQGPIQYFSSEGKVTKIETYKRGELVSTRNMEE